MGALGFYIGDALGFDHTRADRGSGPALRFTVYLPRSVFFPPDDFLLFITFNKEKYFLI